MKQITDEQRAKGLEIKEAKKAYALAHLKLEYSDEPYWTELASKYGVRLPVWYFPASETKHVKRAAKRLSVDINEYLDDTGTGLKEWVELNPTWTAKACVGMFLEWHHNNQFN